MSGTRLPGASVLITGGSSGIGAVTAELLHARGARLTLVGRDAATLGEIGERMQARTTVTDLAEPGAAGQVAESAPAVDVLICNAGIGWAGPMSTMPPDRLEQVITVNLTSALQLVRAVLPGMLDRGRGHVVLVASIAGVMGVAQEAVYAASKAGLVAFAESLRHEVADAGIGVSVVIPGAVRTPFFARRGVRYARSFPQPVSAHRAARGVLAALETGRAEVFVPGWLRLPARLRGLAPGLVRAVQRRVG